MKKILSVLLVFAMLISLAACGNNEGGEKSGEQTAYTEYLNLDSEAPIIKEGHEGEEKPRVLIIQTSLGGAWDDVWVSKYLKEKYNIEFEVETMLDSAWIEKKAAVLAGGDLPDMIFNGGFTTGELYTYGVEDQLFLACDEYIDEELTPNIYKYFQDENVASASTTPDGHVYSLPKINIQKDPGGYLRAFWDTKALEALNKEMPQTLDEFTDVLYAFKEQDPNGVGKENVFPINGGMESSPVTPYILNAFGYIGLNSDAYGIKPALRNGEVVIPAYDIGTYQEFLKLMNQYYNDGIINSNFFTMDTVEPQAQATGGQNILIREPALYMGIETWENWIAGYPLTSEWNAEPQVGAPAYITTGNFVISADTKYPELCMRFADIYYGTDCRKLWLGLIEGTEDCEKYNFDYQQLTLVSDNKAVDFVDLPDGMDVGTYLQQEMIGFCPGWGAIDDAPACEAHITEAGGIYPAADEFDLNNGDQHYRWSTYEHQVPYTVESYPQVYYLDGETSNRLTELTTLIEPYIQEQVALFITGGRSIDEVEQFAQELESMGIEDLLKIYQDIYTASK